MVSRGMLLGRSSLERGTLGRGASALGLLSFHRKEMVTWSIAWHLLHCAVGQGIAGT